MTTCASLCSGIGGLDLAVEAVYGASLAWHAEIERAPAAVHERHWPGVPNIGDITTVDWATLPPVDLICAGYPCQPFSMAGRRLGVDDARHLWPFVADAVRALRPGIVVLENVAGHLTLGFDVVVGDLAEAGYDAEWCCVRASDIGAPHRRDRVFVVATDAAGSRCSWAEDAGTGSGHEGAYWSGSEESQRGSSRVTADTDHAGRSEQRRPLPDGTQHAAIERSSDTTAYPENVGRQRTRLARGRRTGPADSNLRVDWGRYEPAIRRWERITGRPAPHPVDTLGRLSPALEEWMMGYPDGWTSGPSSTARRKMLGNAVVPQQAVYALRTLIQPALVGAL